MSFRPASSSWAFVEVSGSRGVHTGETPAVPRFRVALPSPERPNREGRLPHASLELKPLLMSWHGTGGHICDGQSILYSRQLSLAQTVLGSEGTDRSKAPPSSHRWTGALGEGEC